MYTGAAKYIGAFFGFTGGLLVRDNYMFTYS
jgi:hypothetical protein